MVYGTIQISQNIYFFPNWYNKGIVFVKDVVDKNGHFLSLRDISNIYKLDNIGFLDYYKMKILINKSLSQNLDGINNYSLGPVIPHHTTILYVNKKGSKDMYNTLNHNQLEPKMKKKWNEDLNIIIDSITWKAIFKVCFKVLNDNSSIWFQYRLLNRILGVNKYYTH